MEWAVVVVDVKEEVTKERFRCSRIQVALVSITHYGRCFVLEQGHG
jgi:hypothetical protein